VKFDVKRMSCLIGKVMSESGFLRGIYFGFPYVVALSIVLEYLVWEYAEVRSARWPAQQRASFQKAYKRRFGISLLLFERVGVAWFDGWLLFIMILKYLFICYMVARACFNL